MNKENLINELMEEYQYFNLKREHYNNMTELYKKYNSILEKANAPLSTKISLLIKILIFWILGVSILLVITFLLALLNKILDFSIIKGLIICYVIVIFLTFFIYRIVSKKIFKLLSEKKKVKFKKRITLMEKQYKDKFVELDKYYKSYPNEAIVPFIYSHPDDINNLKEYIENGRANNIKEAINCNIEDEYRKHMKNIGEEILNNSKDIKYSTRSAALFSAINIFMK